MVTSDQLSKLLKSESLHLLQPLDDASNETYLAIVGDCEVVYKPVSGEVPLWDFPPHSLSQREVMAYWLNTCFGWQLVPPTVWASKGPLGPGSVQLFIPNATVSDVEIFAPSDIPASWIPILQGQVDDKDVVVAHRDDVDLVKLAAFDAIINNGDRKAGHILRDEQGNLHAIDHGVSFHGSDKLRTVLWGWATTPLLDSVAFDIRSGLQKIQAAKDLWLLSEYEFEQVLVRAQRLLAEGYPLPSNQWPAIPWPVF
jgi:uncharacterized repeat protein (TIGR03843 family)